MEITSVECLVLDGDYPFVWVGTDDGITIRDEWPILKQPLEVVDGHIAAPDGPGLGVELDDDMVRRLSLR